MLAKFTEFLKKIMTQEEKDIVLHGAKFEMMNRCIDFNDGTVDREKMLNAMQRYAEMYHHNELSKLRQHDVSGRSEQLVCDCKNRKDQFKRGNVWICGDCEKEIKQTNCY